MQEEKLKHIESVLRHIDLVQSSTRLLGERLIESGQDKLGLELIANGLIHDNSKFFGIELEYLTVAEGKSEAFELALHQHVTTNAHHPEYWSGIENMPDVYLCEMICDWHSRSNEFGSSLIEFFESKATAKFKFKKNSKVYKKIKKYINILLNESFK